MRAHHRWFVNASLCCQMKLFATFCCQCWTTMLLHGTPCKRGGAHAVHSTWSSEVWAAVLPSVRRSSATSGSPGPGSRPCSPLPLPQHVSSAAEIDVPVSRPAPLNGLVFPASAAAGQSSGRPSSVAVFSSRLEDRVGRITARTGPNERNGR